MANVEIQLKNAALHVQVARRNIDQPIYFKQLIGPAVVCAKYSVRSDTKRPPGVPQDPTEAVLTGAVECSNVDPPSNVIEVGNCLNDLAGLKVDRLDTYMFENDGDDATSISDAGEEAAFPPFCIFGDHGYALCPTLEKTIDAASEATSQVPKPIGDEMKCTVCGDSFYDPVYLNMHTMYQHEVKGAIPEASPTATARAVYRNHTLSNRENVNSSEPQHTTSRTKPRRPKPEYRQHEDIKPEPNYYEDTKYEPLATYDCFILKCHYKFEEERHLRSHIHTEHSEDRGKYKCLYCGEMLRTASLFYEHYRSHDQAKFFQCAYCERRFWQERSMQGHRCY